MKRETVEAWIAARKAEGMWVRPCLSCGSWFAQPRVGRIAFLCDRRVCELAHRWRNKYGRMPPDSLWKHWRLKYGEMQKSTPALSLRFCA